MSFIFLLLRSLDVYGAHKAIFGEGGSGLPWYAYAAAVGVVAVIGKTIAKVATDMIKDIEDEDNKLSGDPSAGPI